MLRSPSSRRFPARAVGLTQFYHVTFSTGSLDFFALEDSLDIHQKEGFALTLRALSRLPNEADGGKR